MTYCLALFNGLALIIKILEEAHFDTGNGEMTWISDLYLLLILCITIIPGYTSTTATQACSPIIIFRNQCTDILDNNKKNRLKRSNRKNMICLFFIPCKWRARILVCNFLFFIQRCDENTRISFFEFIHPSLRYIIYFRGRYVSDKK